MWLHIFNNFLFLIFYCLIFLQKYNSLTLWIFPIRYQKVPNANFGECKNNEDTKDIQLRKEKEKENAKEEKEEEEEKKMVEEGEEIA